MQIFNQINARKIRDEYNVFDGLWTSKGFLYILAVEIILQVFHNPLQQAALTRGGHRRQHQTDSVTHAGTVMQ